MELSGSDAPASVNRVLQLLSRLFSRAIELKKWHRNPCSKAEMGDRKLLLKGERKHRRRLKGNERERLNEALWVYQQRDRKINPYRWKDDPSRPQFRVAQNRAFETEAGGL